MKNSIKLLFISLLLVVIMTACSSGNTQDQTIPDEGNDIALAEETPVIEEPPLPEESPVVEETQDVTVPDQEVDIEALIVEKIGNNHTLEFILRQDKTAEEWEVTINRMIGYGADISPEEKELIIDYLTSR